MGNADSRLIDAARTGNLASVKELVQGGADKDAKSYRGETALITAAWQGHGGIVRYLAEQGADIHAKSDDGWTALMYAAVTGQFDTVRYLVEQGANVNAKINQSETTLTVATWNGRIDVTKYLVEQGADVNSKGGRRNNTALINSARKGCLAVVRYLVEQGADINAKNNNDKTALMKAARDGHVDVVRYLVEHGADKETKNNRGETALMKAVVNGHAAVVRVLVEEGADKEAENGNNCTALLLAVGRGQFAVVRVLVEQGADKEAKDRWKYTALTRAARYGAWEEVIYLAEQGADIHIQNENGLTALICAAEYGQLDMVRYLVEHGADMEAKDKDGKTVLISAAEKGQWDVVRYLVEHGADSKYALTAFIQDGEFDLAKSLLELGASAAFLDSNGNSTLIILLRRDDDEEKLLPFAKLLLDHGAPPRQLNNQGKSAISFARRKGFYDIMDLIDVYASKPQPHHEEEDPRWLISPDDIVKTGTVLGRGGFGVVYHAKWRYIDVVVKEVTVVEMRQFLKEVNTWRDLRHDNVVPFYGANHRREPFFIVSKYAAKGTLIKYLKSEKEQGRVVVWQKLKEVAAGLAYLHQQGIVHGDLKGNNVVVSDNGTAMLTDFGMSFFEDGSCSIEKRKATLGAMAWRAPEFAHLTTLTPTRKSDVYSLGMCIIEAVTGKEPLTMYTCGAIRGLLRKGNLQVEKPDELKNVQWELVRQMLAVVPEDRPSIDEILRKLSVFAEEEQCPYS